MLTCDWLQGVIESPLYPLLLYSAEPFTYRWTVVAAAGTRIEITFTEFDLEHSHGCYYSHLAVYDGDSEAGRKLFQDCRLASASGPRLVTSSNAAHVVLVGDNVHYGLKFRLQWRQVSEAAASLGPAASSSVNCGGDLALDPGGNVTRLVSPGWPASYPPSLRCEWVVSTEAGSRVQLRIHEVSLEASYYGCPYDR